jgi:hypothetical protein
MTTCHARHGPAGANPAISTRTRAWHYRCSLAHEADHRGPASARRSAQPKGPMSPSDRPKHRTVLVAVATALGVLAPGAVAHAVPASATNFQIFYYTTDEDGNRGRRMTETDLQQFVNRARCECGQSIEAQITLQPMGMSIDQNRIRTFVGTMCGQGQQNVGVGQVDPCVLLDDQLPNFYTKIPSFFFEPIWLKAGVVDISQQSISVAEPAGTCDTGLGEGGIWICVENGMQTDCQSDEFVVTGTQNANVPMGGMAQAISFDFDGPLSLPTGFDVSSGDGALQVSWDFEVTGDVAGYRILCADADGNPVPGKGLDAPDINEQNRGQLYFTQGNLCPDGPFGQGGGEDPTGDGSGTGGDGSGTGGDDVDTLTGGSDAGTDGGAGTSGGALWGETPFGGTVSGGSASGGLDTGGTGGTATDGTGGTGSTGTAGGSDDRGTGGGTATGGDLPSTGIESLDWAYVCSGHIAGNAKNGRVDGLENGQEYQILVVAYDLAGNPTPAHADVLRGTPVETRDLWEQCEEQGNVCGEGGFCQCSADRSVPGALWLSLLVVPALRRRRAA